MHSQRSTCGALFQAFERSMQRSKNLPYISMLNFSDEEWEELSSSYQTLINDNVYETRTNDVPGPEFNYSFVADGDYDNNEEENYVSDLLQQAFASLITPRRKASPCQKPVS